MALPPSIELLLRQTQRGLAQRDARTSAISGALAPFAGRATQNFAPAISQESAVGSAVSSSLAGTGSALGQQLGSALQSIQAPQQSVDLYGGGQAAMGAASGQAVSGLSSAELQRLQGQASAESIYAAALPRLAALTGEQERRKMLSDAQAELGDLALQESAKAADNAQAQREWAYKVRQDQLDRRDSRHSEAWKRKQDKIANKRQARLDRLATQAAAAEYGLKAASTGSLVQSRQASSAARAQSNALRAQSQAETARHHGETEAEARARIAQAKANAAKKTASKSSSANPDKVFYDARDDAFKRAQSYANPKSRLADPMPRAKARVRLWAEFGTMLTGRGYHRATVKTMIENALNAAGY